MTSDAERALRQQLFEHLTEVVADKGTLTKAELEAFQFGSDTRRLIDRSKGIWNPSDLDATLSIMSAPAGPYDDQEISESLFAYDYRAGNTEGDNTKLRRAFAEKVPIIWLRKIRPGVYVPVFPVYVVADDKANQRFLISLDEHLSPERASEAEPLQRQYAKRLTTQRLHQPEFRGRVMLAYDYQCAVCHLGFAKLLDAAHIIADGLPDGTPTVDNGLSLCKIHHAAYDANYLGISPDYKVHISPALMKANDGPMVQHGFQQLNGTKIRIPSKRADRPSEARLLRRFTEFNAAV